jgi:hypothetical protein
MNILKLSNIIFDLNPIEYQIKTNKMIKIYSYLKLPSLLPTLIIGKLKKKNVEIIQASVFISKYQIIE